MKDCIASDFDGNDDQRKYFQSEVVKKKHNFTCLGEEALNLTIEGNIQTRKVHQKRNTYLSLQIDRCKNTKKEPNKCASHEEINKWLYNKQMEPLAFDNKPALKNFD